MLADDRAGRAISIWGTGPNDIWLVGTQRKVCHMWPVAPGGSAPPAGAEELFRVCVRRRKHGGTSAGKGLISGGAIRPAVILRACAYPGEARDHSVTNRR